LAIKNRMTRAWNAFRSGTQLTTNVNNGSPSLGFGSFLGNSSSIPHRQTTRYYNDKTIISSIYNRIAIDAAGIEIRNTKLDALNRYKEDVVSGLTDCFTLEANLDQAPRAFQQDIVATMIDKGVAAIVPVDKEISDEDGTLVDIFTLRVGEIVNWYPKHVRVSLYNETKGFREEIVLEKRSIAIVENPFYSVMNEPSSTLQRLSRKLQLLDVVDEQSSSGKLDLIIQLPYVIKSEARRLQAEKRSKDIEFQLKGSQYGIAYTDGTEKITQLNRPAENNLLAQIDRLIALLYSQLGITEEIMNGTADEKTMLNYYNRTIEPILDAIIQAEQRAFIGADGTKKKQKIQYFKNPFKFVPLTTLADIADKFSRNEILAPNEIRGFLGLPPSKDPKADQLNNSNMPPTSSNDGNQPKDEETPKDEESS